MLGKTGNGRRRRRHRSQRGGALERGGNAAQLHLICVTTKNRKEKTTMKEAMESLAAVAMIAVTMGLAYAAGCVQ